ncbi:MAG TPA: CPBP family intramembrane metalloprotease [Anaerolineales bacterium]|nr:CPBP family intramembrane metalloprotease [Anaerolineales bacterium]HMZ44393.1 CPBP family intramembrane metalloprotease [Anaerolineales bacterium]HNB86365.1 CPBP family intramembrane metalloprotease [Anaerolineales bacterium]HNC88691.1 CPBP family intramembrane metalloprotease [Anaerolineales bacterium]HND91496.1 CPBP family intramembrane metalloprotease [Anaerolineales bacterium]
MNKTIRNIIIVSLFTIGGGWLGIWLNNVTGNTQPPMQSLGVLVWLTTPAFSGFLLRAFGGDGWKDSGFGLNLISGWKWYLLGILVYPLASLLTFGLGALFGIVSAEGFAAQGFNAYLSAAGMIFVGSLMKNFFEEFAWRGYLTPRFEAAKLHPMLNHFIVSLLWMTWHLPYYYYYLDRATLNSAITTSIPVFLLTGYLVMFPTAILFGEIRLLSKSVWPVFILHNIINALSMPLLINGFIEVKGALAPVFTPTNEGILVSLVFGVVGWFLMQYRLKKQVTP